MIQDNSEEFSYRKFEIAKNDKLRRDEEYLKTQIKFTNIENQKLLKDMDV